MNDRPIVGQQAMFGVSYLPPCSVVLRGLGLSLTDLERSKVTVSTEYLSFLIRQVIGSIKVDSEFYRKHYPDVEAAVLAGEISSYQEHFERTGYFEGRLPYEMRFDPGWYYTVYRDVAAAMRPGSQAVQEHFHGVGYYEGRAGVGEDFGAAEMWRLGRSAV